MELGRDVAQQRLRFGDETDWRRIATLYSLLAQAEPSPVIELNRAVAVAMVLIVLSGMKEHPDRAAA